MKETLFLYLDILGFRQLINEPKKIEWLYKALDASRIHNDRNYRTIVFSDTLLAYNSADYTSSKKEAYKSVELMFLIELVQELANRLVGSGITFRAIITEGEFEHSNFSNFEAYYGNALVNAYDSEKSIVGTGLYLDKKLKQFNRVFTTRSFSPEYDFVYILTNLLELSGYIEDGEYLSQTFPIPSESVTLQGVESYVYTDIRHLQQIYTGTQHQIPTVRAKYLATWDMYEKQMLDITTTLKNNNFVPESLIDLNWNPIANEFENNHLFSATE